LENEVVPKKLRFVPVLSFVLRKKEEGKTKFFLLSCPFFFSPKKRKDRTGGFVWDRRLRLGQERQRLRKDG
jgi:hypothetical protein